MNANSPVAEPTYRVWSQPGPDKFPMMCTHHLTRAEADAYVNKVAGSHPEHYRIEAELLAGRHERADEDWDRNDRITYATRTGLDPDADTCGRHCACVDQAVPA